MPKYLEYLCVATAIAVLVVSAIYISKGISAGCVDLGFYKSCGVITK